MVNSRREKLSQFADDLAIELKRVEKSSKKTKSDAAEVARHTASSWSSGGDRFHSQASADVSFRRLTDTKKTYSELEVATAKDIPEIITGTCFVKIEISRNVSEIVLLDNPVALVHKYKLVSFDSPLGKALYGKTTNEEFSYEINNQKTMGKVLEIG